MYIYILYIEGDRGGITGRGGGGGGGGGGEPWRLSPRGAGPATGRREVLGQHVTQQRSLLGPDGRVGRRQRRRLLGPRVEKEHTAIACARREFPRRSRSICLGTHPLQRRPARVVYVGSGSAGAWCLRDWYL